MGNMTQNRKGIRSTWIAIMDAACDAAYEATCAAIYTTQAEYNIAYTAAFKPQVWNKVHILHWKHYTQMIVKNSQCNHPVAINTSNVRTMSEQTLY